MVLLATSSCILGPADPPLRDAGEQRPYPPLIYKYEPVVENNPIPSICAEDKKLDVTFKVWVREWDTKSTLYVFPYLDDDQVPLVPPLKSVGVEDGEGPVDRTEIRPIEVPCGSGKISTLDPHTLWVYVLRDFVPPSRDDIPPDNSGIVDHWYWQFEVVTEVGGD